MKQEITGSLSPLLIVTGILSVGKESDNPYNSSPIVGQKVEQLKLEGHPETGLSSRHTQKH